MAVPAPASLALGLRAKPRWGGRRSGAGRKPGPNPLVLHRSRRGVASRFPCHVTLKVRRDVPSLRTVRLVHELEGSFASLRSRRDFRLVHYSLQGDHAQLLVEAKDREALGRGMKALGARLARAVNRCFRRSGPVLADRYHLTLLKTPRQVRAALRYVLLNGRRHARRLTREWLCDPASSGRWFDGWGRRPGEARGALRGGSRPVAVPLTWLLARGWRIHGLIDPAEVPGRGT